MNQSDTILLTFILSLSTEQLIKEKSLRPKSNSFLFGMYWYAERSLMCVI